MNPLPVRQVRSHIPRPHFLMPGKLGLETQSSQAVVSTSQALLHGHELTISSPGHHPAGESKMAWGAGRFLIWAQPSRPRAWAWLSLCSADTNPADPDTSWHPSSQPCPLFPGKQHVRGYQMAPGHRGYHTPKSRPSPPLQSPSLVPKLVPPVTPCPLPLFPTSVPSTTATPRVATPVPSTSRHLQPACAFRPCMVLPQHFQHPQPDARLSCSLRSA